MTDKINELLFNLSIKAASGDDLSKEAGKVIEELEERVIKPAQERVIGNCCKYFMYMRGMFGGDVFDNVDEMEPFRKIYKGLKQEFSEIFNRVEAENYGKKDSENQKKDQENQENSEKTD